MSLPERRYDPTSGDQAHRNGEQSEARQRLVKVITDVFAEALPDDEHTKLEHAAEIIADAILASGWPGDASKITSR